MELKGVASNSEFKNKTFLFIPFCLCKLSLISVNIIYFFLVLLYYFHLLSPQLL